MSSLRWLRRSADLALRTGGCFQVPEVDTDLRATCSAVHCGNGCYGHTGAAWTPRRHKCGLKTRGKFLVEDVPPCTITRSRAQSHTGEGRRSHLPVCLLGWEPSRRTDQGQDGLPRALLYSGMASLRGTCPWAQDSPILAGPPDTFLPCNIGCCCQQGDGDWNQGRRQALADPSTGSQEGALPSPRSSSSLLCGSS